jgi:hypothetical protein
VLKATTQAINLYVGMLEYRTSPGYGAASYQRVAEPATAPAASASASAHRRRCRRAHGVNSPNAWS